MDLQLLTQTRIDLESGRPHIIDAIRRNRGTDQATFSKLVVLRNDLDSIIDDIYRQQMEAREQVA